MYERRSRLTARQQSKLTSYEPSGSVFWLVFPSLAFFLILPFLLKQGMAFPAVMAFSSVSVIGNSLRLRSAKL